MTATLAQIEAAIERAKLPPKPVRQEGESSREFKMRLENWRYECRKVGKR